MDASPFKHKGTKKASPNVGKAQEELPPVASRSCVVLLRQGCH